MTTDRISFGILPPVVGESRTEPGVFAQSLVTLAKDAELLGFDSFWAGDSLLRARVEPLTLLAHLSAVTSRLTLGTAALVPAYRRPASAAQAIAALDLLSGGRLILAVGAGFPGRSDPEFALAGVPTQQRSARLDDIVARWRSLWSPSQISSPVHFQTHQPGGPPIWLAAGNPAALDRAGQVYDGWLPYPPTVEAYAAGLAQVRAAASAAHRPPVTPALYLTIAVTDNRQAGRQLLNDYCLAGYGAPLDYLETIQLFIGGPPEHIRDQVGRYLEAGARHLIVRLPAIEPDAQRHHLHLLADALPTIAPVSSSGTSDIC